MLQFLSEYGIFLAETVTIVIAFIIIAGVITEIATKGKQKERLQIKKLNQKYQEMQDTLNQEILDKKEFKKLKKQKKQNKKQNKKTATTTNEKRIFVLNFQGDIKASAVDALREAITAILEVASKNDEVVARVESSGGTIHGYGLAASQLRRIRDRGIHLVTTIDKVAASGGYLMACVANHILAAPFAIVGSIGVIGQLPNFHKLLKKHDIDYEQAMAGEFKRTLSLFGENTEKGRKKFQETIEEAHELFKDFIMENRPNLDIKKVATGEYWLGTQALKLGLVDELKTSDDYLLNSSATAKLYEISYSIPRKKLTKLASAIKAGIENAWPFNNLPWQ